MSDPCRRESKHHLSKPCRKRRGAEERRRVAMQSVGDSSLHVVKTGALGIDPERCARLITASVGEPWEDLEPCAAIPQAWRRSESDWQSFRSARSRIAESVAGERLCKTKTYHWTWNAANFTAPHHHCPQRDR